MIQSTWQSIGLHVAVIMDGNGRWATRRGLPRTTGHRAGAKALRRIVGLAPGLGIKVLTVYAFSSDNWKRPTHEVAFLMNLFRRFLQGESAECAKEGVRINVIGRRDRLDPALVSVLEEAEALTSPGETLLLRIAVDYSSRDAIMHAGSDRAAGTREFFQRRLARTVGCVAGAPDVDLLIRTGAERRLSDFLLWESAYAELYFSDTMWPDFGEGELVQALGDFAGRDRRFGGLVARAAV
jgi:undecaprenyl diphosphate synthase